MVSKYYDLYQFKIKYPLMGKWYLLKSWFAALLGLKVEIRLFANPLMKWPVNRKCFCGSKIKFKVCCKRTISTKINFKDLMFIQKRLNQKGIIL